MVQFLLSLKVEVNVADKYGQHPLHRAALFGHHPVVQELIQANAGTIVLDIEVD
jgi:ankyrin repeat protein